MPSEYIEIIRGSYIFRLNCLPVFLKTYFLIFMSGTTNALNERSLFRLTNFVIYVKKEMKKLFWARHDFTNRSYALGVQLFPLSGKKSVLG